MSRPGWQVENEHRDYPLQVPTDWLPREAIADFGCSIGPSINYDQALHHVLLIEVHRDLAGHFTFEFRSDCPDLAGLALIFGRPLSAPEFAVEFADTAPLGSASSAAGKDPPDIPGGDAYPAWEGFLMTGLLETLAAKMAPGGTLTAPNGGSPIEPALVRRAFLVSSVNLANIPSPPPAPAGSCAESAESGSALPGQALPYVSGLGGSVQMAEGYSMAMRVSTADNSLTMTGSLGGGAGLPCAPVSLVPGQAPPPSLQCEDTVLSLNGLSAKTIDVSGGLGVSVSPGPGSNELTVDINQAGTAACPPS